MEGALSYGLVLLGGAVLAAGLLFGVGLVVWRKVMDKFMGYGRD